MATPPLSKIRPIFDRRSCLLFIFVLATLFLSQDPFFKKTPFDRYNLLCIKNLLYTDFKDYTDFQRESYMQIISTLYKIKAELNSRTNAINVRYIDAQSN